jgi:tRNA dimethylallyltransferase
MVVARLVPPVELVAVDAMQVYRGMDIGTAKPSAAERARVAHHGIDLADPSEDFTVVRYRDAARAALSGIESRGGVAVLVAGAGLYLRSVIDHLEPPSSWPDIRAELEADPDTESLHRRLVELDPVAAARMEPTNRRRIIRALEVCIGSGAPFSGSGPGLDVYEPSPVTQIGLRWSRFALHERIALRFHSMLAAGLLDEVARLASRPMSRTARQALGYKELLEHLDGRVSLDEATDRAIARTRRLATRQERWFRRDPRIAWVDIDGDPLVAAPRVLDALPAWV